MGMGCCCACKIRFEDDYSTDRLADDYTVRAGSWSVSGGKLTTSSANALLLVTQPMGSRHKVYTITFVCNPPTTALERKHVVAYVDDNNYLFSILRVRLAGSQVEHTLEVWERSGGSDTLLDSSAVVTRPDLCVLWTHWQTCWEPATGTISTRLVFSANPAEVFDKGKASHVDTWASANGLTSSGVQLGVGTKAAPASVDFDFLRAVDISSKTYECTTCDCDYCIETPQQMMVEFDGLVDLPGAQGTCIPAATRNTTAYILNRYKTGNLSLNLPGQCGFATAFPLLHTAIRVGFWDKESATPGQVQVIMDFDTERFRHSIGDPYKRQDCFGPWTIPLSGTLGCYDKTNATATITGLT